jgi:hypothetical protein
MARVQAGDLRRARALANNAEPFSRVLKRGCVAVAGTAGGTSRAT